MNTGYGVSPGAGGKPGDRPAGISRRQTLAGGLVAAGTAALGPAAFERAIAAPARIGSGPYGQLGPPDANGLMLPKGFHSRVVARGLAPVDGTAYIWHLFSDGAATYATPGGGWILVSNAEVPVPIDLAGQVPLVGNPGDGGASAIRFGREGEILDAYSILSGTSSNCAGGPTPWGTWLSCEEHDRGMVWECDPAGRERAIARPALGTFSHEAACVDPKTGIAYLTEDEGDSGFYRFLPERKGDLSAGRLQVAEKRRKGRVRWHDVPDPSAADTPTRRQVPRMTEFKRGEGIWFNRGYVYIATTRDSKIHRYNTRRNVLRTVYNPDRLENPFLTEVDNITVHEPSGDLFVCEDNGGNDPFDLAIITRGSRRVARFCKLTGGQHNFHPEVASEVAGACFDPSGTRLYFSSQRAFGAGVIYEVTGPFRRGGPRPKASRRRSALR